MLNQMFSKDTRLGRVFAKCDREAYKKGRFETTYRATWTLSENERELLEKLKGIRCTSIEFCPASSIPNKQARIYKRNHYIHVLEWWVENDADMRKLLFD